jgi:DNA polymerase-4
MSDSVAGRLRKGGHTGRTVTLKVRYHDFATITRSHTVPTPIDNGPEITRIALSLLDSVEVGSGVRLLGVGVSNLIEGGGAQLTFDDVAAPGWDKASQAVDDIRARFGERSVGPAALVDEAGLKLKRKGEQQWGPAAT